MLDIRIPIGLMFAIFGTILLAFGIISQYGLFNTDPKIYQTHSMGTNINHNLGRLHARFRRDHAASWPAGGAKVEGEDI